MGSGLKDEKRGIDIAQLKTKIAVIQEHHIEAENLAATHQLKNRTREQGSRRHNFSRPECVPARDVPGSSSRTWAFPRPTTCRVRPRGRTCGGPDFYHATNDVASVNVATD